MKIENIEHQVLSALQGKLDAELRRMRRADLTTDVDAAVANADAGGVQPHLAVYRDGEAQRDALATITPEATLNAAFSPIVVQFRFTVEARHDGKPFKVAGLASEKEIAVWLEYLQPQPADAVEAAVAKLENAWKH